MKDQHIFQPGEVTQADWIGHAEFIANPAPDPSDINGTLAYWDAYRRRKRDEIAASGIREKLVEVTDPITGHTHQMLVGEDFRRAIEIGEFPTEENLAKKARADESAEKVRLASLTVVPTRYSVRYTYWFRIKRWWKKVWRQR